jgi:hypothetical protein
MAKIASIFFSFMYFDVKLSTAHKACFQELTEEIAKILVFGRLIMHQLIHHSSQFTINQVNSLPTVACCSSTSAVTPWTLLVTLLVIAESFFGEHVGSSLFSVMFMRQVNIYTMDSNTQIFWQVCVVALYITFRKCWHSAIISIYF